MTPASNSEARKRALIDRAQKWHATRHERTDPVERLRALADEIAEEDRVGALGWRRWIAGRLYALADEIVPRPPLVSEVIAHLDAGGEVEVYLVVDDRWVECSRSNVTVEDWKKRLAHAGDHPCHGFRLIPKPTTERVPEWPTTKPPTADELLDYLAATALGCATVGPELVGSPDKWTANHEEMVWAHDLSLAMSWIQARDANAADDLAKQIWEADDEGDGYQAAAWRWCIARHVAAEEVQRRALATATKGGRSATERVRLDQAMGNGTFDGES